MLRGQCPRNIATSYALGIYADLLLQSYWYLRLRVAYDVKFLFRLVEHSVHIIFIWNYSFFCVFLTPKKTYSACFPAIVWDILKLESDPLSYLTKVGGLQSDHPIITPAPDMTIYSLKPCGPCSSRRTPGFGWGHDDQGDKVLILIYHNTKNRIQYKTIL